MDRQHFIDRILETENLTDELEDAEANTLLKWGIGQLDKVLLDIVDEEKAGERVNTLMAVMRKINRMIGSRNTKNHSDLAADFFDLNSLCSSSFKDVPIIKAAASDADDCIEAARHLAKQVPSEALDFLIQWIWNPVIKKKGVF